MIFSIDVVALPLLFIPIVLLILTLISFHLYIKNHKNKYQYLAISFFLATTVAIIPYRYASGKELLFWSESFHISTLAVLLGLGTSHFFFFNRGKKEDIIYGFILFISSFSLFLGPSSSGTITGTVLFTYGIYLFIKSRSGIHNEIARSLKFTVLGILGALSHWFFLSSAAFLYSLLLVAILVHELLKIFNRIVLMMNSSGVNSITDPLTGLYNKRFLMTKAEQLVA